MDINYEGLRIWLTLRRWVESLSPDPASLVKEQDATNAMLSSLYDMTSGSEAWVFLVDIGLLSDADLASLKRNKSDRDAYLTKPDYWAIQEPRCEITGTG